MTDKIRLGIGFILIAVAIGLFVYGWMERSVGSPFNQIWMLAIFSLLGAMVQLQKIGGGQKRSRKKGE
ncbi:MAG: hypothetical protein HOA15_02630 [Candidatus Marinimicrobia bacterium]|nr:hypothetical protein [Candidatus Neomarinimicrobiota bacterium]MBT4067554.1 hypothetical protein [Candidatus Neomarinimicrobiota bacterium]MBT4372734.1 hypothetical protein [Candidatus Neomarinimicrobiota bacterium]MBT4809450.1 hypothetical protein [Candidatus Neomarinimicrobiota bacterium]MBT6840793.1 hypothetical protein [Candidatus Neomarinimicrobiota bacterium]